MRNLTLTGLKALEQLLRCALNDHRHPGGLEQLKQNLDVCKKGPQTRWTDRTRTYGKRDHHGSFPNARLGAHGASLQRGNQPDGINGKGEAKRHTVQWKGTDRSTSRWHVIKKQSCLNKREPMKVETPELVSIE